MELYYFTAFAKTTSRIGRSTTQRKHVNDALHVNDVLVIQNAIGAISINIRILVSHDIVCATLGYGHNAVEPIGCKQVCQLCTQGSVRGGNA